MRLRDLPDWYPVTIDTETSGTQTDSGARVAAFSYAFREPDEKGQSNPSSRLISRAIPFDQGLVNLPMGAKQLNAATQKRLAKWPDWGREEDAHNESPAAFRYLMKQLSRLGLVYHNSKFDMNMLRKGLRGDPTLGVDLEDQLEWDTMLAQRILNARGEFDVGLKPVAVRKQLGAELGVREGMEDEESEALKPWLGPRSGKNNDPRYDLVPWSVMGPYAAMDAKLTLLLWELQLEEIDPELGGRHFERRHVSRELELCKVLYRMEHRGIGYDVKTSFAMSRMLGEEQARIADLLPFDPTPVKARTHFFGSKDQGGLDHFRFSDKLTPKKQDPQVDDEVIERLAKEEWVGQQDARTYQKHEGVKSAISKWYQAWADRAGADSRLRTSFKQADVVSGRLAVGHIQLQAIPHSYQLPKVEGLVGVRDLFFEDQPCPCDACAGRRAKVLWEFDISQAEIRIATAVCRCKPMLRGFLRGDDSHSIATRLMFGAVFKADGYEGREEAHPLWGQFRQVAKRCNLGILYGAGAVVIREQIMKFTGIVYPMDQVREWIAMWKAAFPEMHRELDKTAQFAVNNGWVKLLNGRQRWFTRFEPAHKALNQVIQGSLAETMKDVMIEVENAVPDSMLLQIHDSLVMRLCPERYVEQGDLVQKILTGRFERAFTLDWGKRKGGLITVPFTSDAKPFGRKEYSDA